jgi:glutathione S-transferase
MARKAGTFHARHATRNATIAGGAARAGIVYDEPSPQFRFIQRCSPARRVAAAALMLQQEVAMPHYTAIVTLLSVALYFFLATRVAAAHGKFDVRLPATTGNPDFERIFRVHVNTLEWMPSYLVPLWLCAIYLSDAVAAALGLVWIVGRVVYFIGYSRAVEKRLPGFFIQSMACLLLFIGATAGVIMHVARG